LVFRLLVVVPCGQAKIWKKEPTHGPAKAKNAYIGAPFRVNRTFAERFADKWIILSAKYGLIDPDFIIPEDYDVTFTKPSTNPITVDDMKNQLKDRKDLLGYDAVIALGGQDYTDIVKQVFMNFSKVLLPTEGLSLFETMHEVSSLSKLEKTEMLKRVTKS
jgi:hypothetical protein